MKKLIAGLAVFAIFAFAASTFASEGWFGGDVTTKIKVYNDNNAVVTTQASSTATTGGNTANVKVGGDSEGSIRVKGGRIETGDAISSTAVLVGVNNNTTDISANGCGCERDGDTSTYIKVKNRNNAVVATQADSRADTGNNTANVRVGGDSEGSIRVRGGSIFTGMADSMTSVGVIANTNWTTIH